jgi:hypothetical protein
MIQSTIRGTAGDRVSPVHYGLASEAALHNHLLKWGGGIRVLTDAVSERPVFHRGLHQVDEDIFWAHALLSGKKLSHGFK